MRLYAGLLKFIMLPSVLLFHPSLMDFRELPTPLQQDPPALATTDRAAIYPPALNAVLPEVTHIRGKLVQQRIERDHQHPKGRTRSMHGFQTLPCAQVVCAGHGFMRNLRNGFYSLGGPGGDVHRRRSSRLVHAWDELTVA